MRNHFGRSRRILRTDDFSSVFRLPPVFKTSYFVVHVCPNALGHARLGVVVGKRLAHDAYVRNTVKRVVRERFRQTALFEHVGIDCVVRLRAKLSPCRAPGLGMKAIKKGLHEEALALFTHISRRIT